MGSDRDTPLPAGAWRVAEEAENFGIDPDHQDDRRTLANIVASEVAPLVKALEGWRELLTDWAEQEEVRLQSKSIAAEIRVDQVIDDSRTALRHWLEGEDQEEEERAMSDQEQEIRWTDHETGREWRIVPGDRLNYPRVQGRTPECWSSRLPRGWAEQALARRIRELEGEVEDLRTYAREQEDQAAEATRQLNEYEEADDAYMDSLRSALRRAVGWARNEGGKHPPSAPGVWTRRAQELEAVLGGGWWEVETKVEDEAWIRRDGKTVVDLSLAELTPDEKSALDALVRDANRGGAREGEDAPPEPEDERAEAEDDWPLLGELPGEEDTPAPTRIDQEEPPGWTDPVMGTHYSFAANGKTVWEREGPEYESGSKRIVTLGDCRSDLGAFARRIAQLSQSSPALARHIRSQEERIRELEGEASAPNHHPLPPGGWAWDAEIVAIRRDARRTGTGQDPDTAADRADLADRLRALARYVEVGGALPEGREGAE